MSVHMDAGGTVARTVVEVLYVFMAGVQISARNVVGVRYANMDVGRLYARNVVGFRYANMDFKNTHV